MHIEFENSKILVTGGTKGIGEAIAKAFVLSKGEVFVTGTSDSSYAEFKKNNPELKSQFIKVDFSEPMQVQSYTEKISKLNFDILVNNAGINKIDSLDEINVSDWQKIQDVNVRGPFLTAQTVAKKMKERKYGRILNIASVFGVVTKEKRLSYTTSKAALIGMTKTMALDLAPFGVLVNALSPGFIDTSLTRKILGDNAIQEMLRKVPLQRLGTTDDIANLALYLCSKKNGFITGQNIIADGGFTCA